MNVIHLLWISKKQVVVEHELGKAGEQETRKKEISYKAVAVTEPRGGSNSSKGDKGNSERRFQGSLTKG